MIRKDLRLGAEVPRRVEQITAPGKSRMILNLDGRYEPAPVGPFLGQLRRRLDAVEQTVLVLGDDFDAAHAGGEPIGFLRLPVRPAGPQGRIEAKTRCRGPKSFCCLP